LILLAKPDSAAATETRSKQMPGQAKSRVDHRAVSPMRLAERASEPFAVRGRRNQVNVIGHRTMAPDLDVVLGQRIPVEFKVGLREKHGLAPIAALGDVMPPPASAVVFSKFCSNPTIAPVRRWLKMRPEPGPVGQSLSEIGKSPRSWICARSNAGGEGK
jgi:hypothetical protein